MFPQLCEKNLRERDIRLVFSFPRSSHPCFRRTIVPLQFFPYKVLTTLCVDVTRASKITSNFPLLRGQIVLLGFVFIESDSWERKTKIRFCRLLTSCGAMVSFFPPPFATTPADIREIYTVRYMLLVNEYVVYLINCCVLNINYIFIQGLYVCFRERSHIIQNVFRNIYLFFY